MPARAWAAWKWIRWSDVRYLRVGFSPRMPGVEVYQSIGILTSLPRSSGQGRAATVFGTKVRDKEDMIRLLSHYIAQYRIPVEEISAGVHRRVDRIQ
jgi:hypothetical protein